MHNGKAPFPAENADLSYDDIQSLVREGRRQRAVAVREGLAATTKGVTSVFMRAKDKIEVFGTWLNGRTA